MDDEQLVIDCSLNNLPRRTTDSAFIVRSQTKDGNNARVFKLNAKESGPLLVERCAHRFGSLKVDHLSFCYLELMV